MSQIVADAAMAKQIEGTTGPVTVVNEHGNAIGYFTPIQFPKSPYPREEIERRRADVRKNGGRTTAQVLARLRELEEKQ